jgi:hypothetical protein
MAQSMSDYLKSYGVDTSSSTSKKTSSSTSKKTSSNSSKKSSGSSSGSSKSKVYETWESGGRTYVDGIDIGPAGTKIDVNDGKVSNSMDAYLAQNGVSPNMGEINTERIEYNPYEDAYRESQRRYEELEAQIREQNRLAVEQGTNRLNAQKSNINQAADENARQAYIQYMQSQKALPQQLASQGVSGGATETANLGLQTAYQNNVNAINQNKANRLQEIDNAIVDLQNTGDLSTVEQVLANNQAALDAYMSNFDKGVSYNQWANQFNANRVDANRNYDAQQLQAYLDQINEQDKLLSEEKKEEKNNILKLYTSGYMSRDDAAARLGYDPEILYDTMGYLSKENELALKDKQTDISNTQSLINNRNENTPKRNQTYSQVLSEIQKLNSYGGEDYTENLASARYLLNSDLDMADVISIMKQTNVRPEMFVKQMVDQGLSEQDVVDFINAYVPESKQEYRDSLYLYAYN